MKIDELRVDGLRNIDALRLEPEGGINLLTGGNGAGKTSILEAIYLLSHGRSFRAGGGHVLRGRDAETVSIFGLVDAGGAMRRLGLQQTGGRWIARVDGQDRVPLAAMLAHCAVVCFEPGSHALIYGSSEERRRFLDWGVFHVEPTFVATARRFRAALKLRNAALRERRSNAELDAWDRELVQAAGGLVAARSRYIERLSPLLVMLLARYLGELGTPIVRRRSHWIAGDELLEALREARSLDRERGHTSVGPHRADWQLAFEHAPRREHLSRGQEKLCALACVLAQAELYRADHQGGWPIVLLDDLASELDVEHQDLTLASLSRDAQVFITGTEVPDVLRRQAAIHARFHVERGRVQRLV